MIKKIIVILLSCAVLVSINMMDRFDAKTGQHILIIGTAKSGTTAIYKSIKDEMVRAEDKEGKAARLVSFFEPSAAEFQTALRSRAKNLIVKITLIDRAAYKNLYKDIEAFDKQIMIIRDPRDILISNLLYNTRWMRFSQDPERRAVFLKAIEEKEQDPSAHSLLSLYQLRDKLESEVMLSWETPRSWHDEYNDYAIAVRMIDTYQDMYVLRYEDYIDNKLSGVQDYIGLEISGNADVSSLREQHSLKKSVNNIARSKAYGNWKNWFTADDVKTFRPLFQPLMSKAGYADEWALNSNPVIKPENASLYLKRIINKDRN
jgi:hypothetical protein